MARRKRGGQEDGVMVMAKHEAEGASLDGCEPNPWVLRLLGELQPG